MTDAGQNRSLESWSTVDLLQLLQEVNTELSIRSFSATRTDYINVQHATGPELQIFGPSAPIPQYHDDSISRANSAYSGETFRHELSDWPRTQVHSPFVDNTSVAGQVDLRNAFPPASSTGVSNNTDRTCSAETSKEVNAVASPASDNTPPPVMPRFFCTYCWELGTLIDFGTKHDWKRHEKRQHETGEEWQCRFSDCLETFARGTDLKNHYKKTHDRNQIPPNTKTILPAKRIYACGFDGCRKLSMNWGAYCDHVARCMGEGGKKWTYDNRLRNLLRHDTIAPAWKEIRGYWCKQLMIDHSQLSWDPKTSRTEVLQLESHNFKVDTELGDLLERVFLLGRPAYLMFPISTHPPNDIELTTPTAFLDSVASSSAPLATFHENTEIIDPPLLQAPSTADTPILRPAPLTRVANENTAYRNSWVMEDAPAPFPVDFHNPQNLESAIHTASQKVFEEGVDENFSINKTPPLPEASSSQPAIPSKSSPTRRLWRRSIDLLHNLSPQHYNTTPNDLPSSPRRPTAVISPYLGSTMVFPNI